MGKYKRILAALLMLALTFAFTACGSSGGGNQTGRSSRAAEQEQAQSDDEKAGETGTLVVYFSATGTTKGVAEKIATLENADIYEIEAAQPYTDEDLNYNDEESRTTKEQNDASVRPEIGSDVIDISAYSKLYIGYPIWWGEEPRIMDTFVESYDFGDMVIIPFCTSGGSGIGRSGENLAGNAGSGNWQSGERLERGISDADLQEWIDQYK